MRLAVLALLASLVCPVAFAQTTYKASNVPFACDAATAARVPLSWSMFVCRGVLFGSSGIELFFRGNGMLELFTPAWTIGPYSASLSLTSFTQPDPPYCDVINHFCASGKQDGAITFNWSGTDANGVLHSGTVSIAADPVTKEGGWYNRQVCGGRGCQWYHPFLDSLSLTINQ